MIPMNISSVARTGAGVAAAVAACLALASCGLEARAASGPRIITSVYPLQYLAQRVAGPGADVTNLTPPGREPHDVELSLKQTADLAGATVVLYERGLSGQVDDSVDAADPGHVVDAAKVAGLVPARSGSEAAAEGSARDPHFWLDPTRLAAVATAFEAELAKAEPQHAASYARNLAALTKDLAGLDAAIRAGLAQCVIRTVVVSHDAFEYFGRRYGLDVVAINGLSPDAEPSPAHIKALHDLIEHGGITTVFTEELASPQMADTLAHDLHVSTAVLDPVEGLSDATKHDDYLSLMRRNLAALRKADRCT
jgi:zinc transport system substrate-binding protein